MTALPCRQKNKNGTPSQDPSGRTSIARASCVGEANQSECSQSKELTTRDPERISVGLTGIHAEGQRSTAFVMFLLLGGLVAAFAMGKLSAVFDACFGFNPF